MNVRDSVLQFTILSDTLTHTQKKEYCIRMLSLSKIPNEI
jgi:hypothetical protein